MIEFTGRAENNSVVVYVALDGEQLTGGPLYLSLAQWDRLRAHPNYGHAAMTVEAESES